MVDTSLISFLRYAVAEQEQHGLDCLSMELIDGLSGLDFETVCAYILLHQGFEEVFQTVATGDYGADIIARDRDFSYAIQCKRQQAPVGSKAVQEVFAGKSYYNCSKAVVLTNSVFTRPARILAEDTGVILLDRSYIEGLILN